jgi:hypothetical protein
MNQRIKIYIFWNELSSGMEQVGTREEGLQRIPNIAPTNASDGRLGKTSQLSTRHYRP